MTLEIDDAALGRAINHWEKSVPIEIMLDLHAYRNHLLEEHGIAVGRMGAKSRIVDEQKYTVFLLRFG